MTSTSATPILTVPANLQFDISSSSPHEEDNNDSGYDIYLNENWDSGIGGGLWTTGSALAKYFITSPHFLQQIKRIRQNNNNEVEGGGDDDDDDNKNRRRPLRVLELGSGNGFLSVCLVVAVAVATANMNNNDENENNNENNLNNNNDENSLNNNNDVNLNWPGIEIVVTDTKEHLQLMKDTIDSNLKRILPQILEQYLWGNKDYDFSNNGATTVSSTDTDDVSSSEDDTYNISNTNANASTNANANANVNANTSTNTNKDNHFDLIIGSDVAYRDYLHEPLIDALKEFSSSQSSSSKSSTASIIPTVSLIGITMNDTKPIFFQKLIQAGFQYEKLAEHLFDTEYNTCSRQFGIFAITRTSSGTVD
ncbi:hypothetical protein FRACYDRAFT_250089 [Fragilariopsis cylindrus CCMP1102]|uniref:Uncharacterized protein n=1 Tax=Fragilariopsis cylindrus CCMP1102 TaxID=635003 RepID=A0A1E7EQL5_9STRA|nr:hypothetical protein FRACYDRAFT_250089 [Fragilariopsis cylindrus CCMP1102]|eukprot:OEU08300.1 hypothetical protein FRACYDRAFT_250089 [Fragilariopsis cylindrus CCMP1102]